MKGFLYPSCAQNTIVLTNLIYYYSTVAFKGFRKAYMSLTSIKGYVQSGYFRLKSYGIRKRSLEKILETLPA